MRLTDLLEPPQGGDGSTHGSASVRAHRVIDLGRVMAVNDETRDDVAQHLFEVAFSRQRIPRSEPYKTGVLHGLLHGFGQNTPPPYELGTPEADAYLAGREEGNTRAGLYLMGVTHG